MITKLTPTGIKSRLSHPQESYEFKAGVNLLVGQNGCGKSSLLYAMRPRHAAEKLCTYELDRSKVKQVSLLWLDFEKDNPRTKSMFDREIDGQDNFSRTVASFHSKFMSHGESSRMLLRTLEQEVTEENLVILDEPEQALDFAGLQELKRVLARLPVQQVIIATHSPWLILEPSYHVVELTPNYRKTIREELQRLRDLL